MASRNACNNFKVAGRSVLLHKGTILKECSLNDCDIFLFHIIKKLPGISRIYHVCATHTHTLKNNFKILDTRKKQNENSNCFQESRHKVIRQKYKYTLHIIVLFFCHCFFLLPTLYTICIFPLPPYSHHIRILGFKATRIPKIMYRSPERDRVTGGKNEYY